MSGNPVAGARQEKAERATDRGGKGSENGRSPRATNLPPLWTVAPPKRLPSGGLFFVLGYFEQLDVEHQGGVGRDHAATALLAVGELGRDGELAHAADLHAFDALVPALDDIARAEGEVERVAAAAAGVELLAVGELADVVHEDVVAGARRGAAADDQVLDDQAAGDEVVGFLHGGLLSGVSGVGAHCTGFSAPY